MVDKPKLRGIVTLEGLPMNNERVQSIYDAIQAGDRERIRSWFSPNLIHHHITLAMQFKGFDAAFDGVREALEVKLKANSLWRRWTNAVIS